MNEPSPLSAWVGAQAQIYLWLAAAVILAATGWAVLSWWRAQPGEKPRSDWKWGLVLLAILLAGRWPSMIIPRELNPDESHQFASAHALTHDPVFWRSVDGHTAGPLNFFYLIPAGWLGGWDSYLAVRISALVLLAATLALVHQCLALVYPPRAVRLATAAAATFEALSNAKDFLHYSSELLPVLWLSVAAYAAVRRWRYHGSPLWSGLGGLMLGAVPMSKLQPAPLALIGGLCWLWAELRTRGPEAPRHRAYLLAGAVLPSALFVLPVVLAGQWDNFIIPYLRFNVSYAAAGETSLSLLLERLLENSITHESLLERWGPGMIIWCALAFRVRALADRGARTFTLFALAATVLSILCVLHAGRPFLHYWQLVVPPLTLLLGALLGNLALVSGGPTRFERGLMAACAVALLTGLGGHRLRWPNRYVGHMAFFEAHPRTRLSDHVRAQAQPGETIAIWGWSSFVYVETGLRQVTREAHIERLLVPGPYQAFLRERFLIDVLVMKPAIFLDSVGPSSLFFYSPELKHDRVYPELAAAIRANYVLVDAIDGAEIYRRRDLLAP